MFESAVLVCRVSTSVVKNGDSKTPLVMAAGGSGVGQVYGQSGNGSKTAIVVDDISTGIEGSICVYRHGKKHPIFFLQNGSEYVYFYDKNNTRKATVHLPAKCHCMCVTTDVVGTGHLLCGLCDGRIIQYNLGLFKDEPKPKKEKRDRHRVKQMQTEGSLCARNEKDIFGELLEGTDMEHSCSYVLPPARNCSENLTFLGENHVLLREPNIQDLLWVKESLITCAQCNTGWTVSVYHQTARDESSRQSQDTAFHQMTDGAPSCTCRTFIPMSEITPSDYSDGGVCSHPRPSQHFEDSKCVRKRPQVYCVISQSILKSTKLTCATGRIMAIEDGLYNQLFGEDINFLDTAVILICLPDGRIVYTPLRIARNDPVSTSMSDVCQSTPTSSSECITIRTALFHVLDQPVACVHSINTKASETEQNVGDCVCIVGKFGRVIQITENSSPDAKEKLHIFEHFVKGPVQATCKIRTQQTLLYSTGKEVLSLSLSKSSQEATSASGSSDISTSLLTAVAKIMAMAFYSAANKYSKRSPHLIALTTDGRVLKIHLPAEGSCAQKALPITAEQAGKRVQGLLKAIGAVSDRSAELAKLGELQDQILQDRSEVCHLASLLTSDRNRHEALLSAKIDCMLRSDGGLWSLELLCQLTNHSPWTLAHGWSLVVSVDMDPDWKLPDRDLKCRATKSVPLVDLKPTKMVSVVFPASCMKVPFRLPIEVQCFLHFSLKNSMHVVLQGNTNIHEKSQFEVNETGVSFLIAQQKVVDLVTFSGPAQSHPSPINGSGTACVQDSVLYGRGCKWLASALENPSVHGNNVQLKSK